jgi:hypothetical protein
MGESQCSLFQPDFNRSIHVEARPERLSADAGALLLRELLDRSGLSRLLDRELVDLRAPERITHPLPELLRTQLLLDAQGYADQNDATLLRQDPLFRLSVSAGRGLGALEPGRGLASQPTLSRLLQMLAAPQNRAALARVLRSSAECLGRHRPREEEITLDLDSLPLEVHGHQPGSAYHGHYRVRCYHPLLLRESEGFYLAARLREGHVHTAEGALDFALPVLRDVAERAARLWLRIDAGFPAEGFLAALEALPALRYVARLKTNAALERLAQPHLRRPPGRAPAEGRLWLHELSYRARSWSRARRVVLVVLERPDEQQHLFLDHFFLVTNASAPEESADTLLERYRARGSAEQDFGAWQQALTPHLSSSPRPKRHYRGRRVRTAYKEPDSFAANEARLCVSLLAANLLWAASRLLKGTQRRHLSRARFRALVLKVAARVLVSGRRIRVGIDAARAGLWSAVWLKLERLYPSRGSPRHRALPLPA